MSDENKEPAAQTDGAVHSPPIDTAEATTKPNRIIPPPAKDERETAANTEKQPHPAWDFATHLIPWVFGLIVLLCFYGELKSVSHSIVQRLRMGAAVNIKGVEIGATQASTTPSPREISAGIFPDDGTRKAERDKLKDDSRGVMLVHTISRSSADDQLYDVVIYLVPHIHIEDRDSDQTANLLQVKRVEYFFGDAWNNRVFSSITRNNGFAVAATAYGPFLCTAKVYFNDGHSTVLNRYIDFEMGNYAPPSASSGDKPSVDGPK